MQAAHAILALVGVQEPADAPDDAPAFIGALLVAEHFALVRALVQGLGGKKG